MSEMMIRKEKFHCDQIFEVEAEVTQEKNTEKAKQEYKNKMEIEVNERKLCQSLSHLSNSLH